MKRAILFFLTATVLLTGVVAAAVYWFQDTDGRDGIDPLADLKKTAKASEPTPSLNTVTVFFTQADGAGLVQTQAEIEPTGDTATEAAAVVKLLLAGPPEDAETGPLTRPLPATITLNGLYLDGKGTAYVDLGGTANLSLGGTFTELLAAYAITDSLAYSFPGEIRRVRLLLDGRESETLAGHVAIGEPLRPRKDLVVGKAQK